MIRNLVYFRCRSVGGWRTHSSMKDLLSRLKNNNPAGDTVSKGEKLAVSSERIPASSSGNSAATPAMSPERIPASSSGNSAATPAKTVPTTVREAVKSDNKAAAASVPGSTSRLTDILRESSKSSTFGMGTTGLNQAINVFTKGKAISGGGNTYKFSENILQKTLTKPPSTFTSSLFKEASESAQKTSIQSKFAVDSKPLSPSTSKSTFGEIFRSNADSINSAARGNLPTSVRDAQRNATERVLNNLLTYPITRPLTHFHHPTLTHSLTLSLTHSTAITLPMRTSIIIFRMLRGVEAIKIVGIDQYPE